MPNCACCITARMYAYAYVTLKSSFENFQQKLRQVKLEGKEKRMQNMHQATLHNLFIR